MPNPFGKLAGQPDLPEWVDMGDTQQSDIAQSLSPLMDILKMKVKGAKGGGDKGGTMAGASGKSAGMGAESL